MAQKAGFAAVIALFMLAMGEALGNIAPDFSDVMYYSAVINGTIANGVTAFLVYDIYPALQYFALAAFIGLTWYFTENVKLTIAVGVYMFSIVYIVSTILLFGLFSQVIPDYSIPVDIITCIACVVAILSVNGMLTWENFKRPFSWIADGIKRIFRR